MRLQLIAALCLLVTGSVVGSETGETVRCCAELMASTCRQDEIGRPFEMTVRLTTDFRPGGGASFAVEDKTGAMLLYGQGLSVGADVVSAGSKVRVKGVVDVGKRSRECFAHTRTLEVFASGPAPEPVSVTAEMFLSGKYDCRLVRIRGRVRDIVPDEIDPHFVYLILSLDGGMVFVPFRLERYRKCGVSVGSEMELSGICTPSHLGARRQIGRHLSVVRQGVRVVSVGKENPFDVPDICELRGRSPQEITLLGHHKTVGCVRAVWQRNRVLLRTDSGNLVRVEVSGSDVPKFGERIEAVGFPESDLYRINLGRALWRRLAASDGHLDAPVAVTADRLQTDVSGRRCFDPYAHGRAIRLRGIVRTFPQQGNEEGRFSLESGSTIVTVDGGATPSALRGLSVGCEILVSGTCIMEGESWRPNVPFPTIRGVTIVIRAPDDVTILARPSWWTPQRLICIVVTLLVVLLGSLVWSTMLKKLAERRGRELAKTAIAKAESDLRVFERTRLAVELHDTVSQNLTGVSLAIRAAEKVRETDAALLDWNLKLAASALNSCRQELRNCLWDLRNLTLDEQDLNVAIWQTLSPFVGDADLSIRFNVPRDRFTDHTAHVLLHILRELASNAVRHGKATHIRIAGSIEGGRLLFSVRDDGCGFDPDTCPGMAEGHYGLQGIRERVNHLDGKLKIESSAGMGTRVSVSVRMPKQEGERA